MDCQPVSEWTRLQDAGVARLWSLADTGHRAIVACAPTGFGKTRTAKEMIRGAVARRWKWIFYTHRKLLFQQTHDSMMADGISHGCRASGWRDFYMPHADGQLAMIQSEVAAFESGKRQRFQADMVLVDEAHANRSGAAEAIIREHLSDGAVVIGLSATPVGLGHLYKSMEVLALTSQARKVGALLPAKVFAPDEVDVSDVKRVSVDGEFSQKALARKFQNQQVVGSVFKHWKERNPEGWPALGFAPGVKESMWFCDEFISRGVPSAHIDGEKVYLGEKDSAGDPIVYRGLDAAEKRLEVFELSKAGKIPVIWNRFVMREGVDLPHLYHGIFATAFGTVEGWLQSCGRILRYHKDYDHVLITDHGGNVWRPGLGSPNADREWTLNNTNSSIRKEAQARMEKGKDDQPKGCPKCHNVVSFGFWEKTGGKCPNCGFKFTHSVRCVFQTDGQLREIKGNAVKVKNRAGADAQKEWDKVYFPSSKSKNPVGSTFNQLRGRFEKQSDFRLRTATIDGVRKTIAVHRETGEQTVLRNVPPPGSIEWERQVKKADRKNLQGNANEQH